jgi:23S rRNA-/tRNA-specific pseudouridylate synthase
VTVQEVEKKVIDKGIAPKVYYPHRLDKHSSGLLVLCLNAATVSVVGKSLYDRLWAKKYGL